jgi:hypothetical protein
MRWPVLISGIGDTKLSPALVIGFTRLACAFTTPKAYHNAPKK